MKNTNKLPIFSALCLSIFSVSSFALPTEAEQQSSLFRLTSDVEGFSHHQKDGQTTLVTGRFDIGGARGDSPELVKRNLLHFIQDNARSFALPEGWSEKNELRLVKDHHLNDDLRVLRFEQVIDGLLVVDAKVVVTIFKEDGALATYSGDLVQNAIARKDLDAATVAERRKTENYFG